MDLKNNFENWEKSKYEEIIESFGDKISSPTDITGGDDPSTLFYFVAKPLSYLLDNDPDKIASYSGVKIRRALNPIVKGIGSKTLSCKQVIENRYKLLDPESTKKDPGIVLPDRPVIYVSNHYFKEDILATTLAVPRHAYILLASLPQVFNTFDGVTAWINGTVLMNRKVKDSRHSVISKASRVMNLGADMIYFAEGVWNKTPNVLVMQMFPGLYKLAKATGTYIVPISHYIEDATLQKENNVIHTVIDTPIRIDNMEEEEALETIREKLGTWHYLMMEKYGKTTRAELLNGFENADEAFEDYLQKVVGTVQRYDKEIELCADYRPKNITRPEDAFQAIANVQNESRENYLNVESAKRLVKERQRADFQRRF